MTSEIVKSEFVWPVEVVGFKIYYGDGSVVSSAGYPQEQWGDLWAKYSSVDDVQVVNVYYSKVIIKRFEERHIDEDGKLIISIREENRRLHDIIHGQDWYWFNPEKLEFGMATDLPSVPVEDAKQGKLLSDETWIEIYNLAYNDYTL